jgi:hypothetical protein
MTKEYDNELRGVLFKNDRKESDNHPDYKGSAQVDGVDYWLSAWIKTGAKGKFMSLSFTEKEQPKSRQSEKPVKQGRDHQRAKQAGLDSYEDDDVPF